jgi:hypothetical protein
MRSFQFRVNYGGDDNIKIQLSQNRVRCLCNDGIRFAEPVDVLEVCQVSNASKNQRYMPGIVCFERLNFRVVTMIYLKSKSRLRSDDITKIP